MTLPLALAMPGPMELMIILGIGLLFFGKRLPEVGRGMAKSIVEFKKGLKDVEDDVSNVGESKRIDPVDQNRLS